MQVTTETISILKNFATINQCILIEPGSNLSVVAKTAVLARAAVSETFPVQIGIYDLSNFLSVAGLFKAPDFNFQGTFVHIRDTNGDGEVMYRYAEPSCLGQKPPKKLATIPAEFIEFHLPEEKWVALQRAASVLDKTEVRVLSDGGAITMTTYDSKYPNGHEYSMPLEGNIHGFSCNTVFQVSNLKLLKGSYGATVTPNYTVFTNKSGYNLTYWVGCDPQSTFE
jgi:hypothetical protein